MGCRTWLALAVVAALAGCTSAPVNQGERPPPADTDAPPAPVRGFAFAGQSCQALQTTLPVDHNAVASLLPDGFKPLLDETGKATLVATVRNCERLRIELGNTNATTWSDVGILIEPYGGVLGTAIYQFWGAANTTDLAKAFTTAGFPQQVSPDWMAWSWAADPAAGIWSAGMHAAPGLATVVAPFGGVPLVPMPSHTMHGWHHEGENLVHIDYGLDPLLAAGAQTGSTITAPPGSALERLLGQPSAVATTSLVVLSMDARVSVT